MPPADRTHPVILDHFNAIINALEAANLGFPVGEWARPEDLDSRFVDPPFALVRIFPSAGQFEGPLSDTQVDITIRFQIMGIGKHKRQGLNITDRCSQAMQARNLNIPNRYVQSVQYMVVSGGISRDDDLPLPFYQSVDLYELMTTPA